MPTDVGRTVGGSVLGIRGAVAGAAGLFYDVHAMRLLRVSALALGLVACEESVLDDTMPLEPPPPVTPSGIDIATYHAAAHTRLCALLEECCTPTESLFVPTCEDRLAWYESQARFHDQLVESGRARWDPDAAEACAATFDTMTCDDLVRTDYALEPCPDALVYLESPPSDPCADYPCEAGTWCRPDGDSHVCRPDRAEGAICTDDPAACGDRQRCRRPNLADDRYCQPPLCDSDPANDPRTVLTEFYRGRTADGHTMTVECALPPDGFFECSCVFDGVASSCRSDQLFDLDVDFSNYVCC